MIHKVVTSCEFPYFAIPPKVYKKSEAVVSLDRNPDRRGAELYQD